MARIKTLFKSDECVSLTEVIVSICDPVIEQILVNPLSVTWRFHMIAPLKQSIFLVMAFHLLLPLDRCFRQDELFYFVEWVIKENCKHLSSFNVVIG